MLVVYQRRVICGIFLARVAVAPMTDADAAQQDKTLTRVDRERLAGRRLTATLNREVTRMSEYLRPQRQSTDADAVGEAVRIA